MDAFARLAAVRSELRGLLVERDEVVDGLLVALLARHHILLLGPPGTAKSMVARELVRRLQGATLFEWLLTKFSTPEEIFGPPSLPALEAGRYERVTAGKLPEASVAFLDEIFKANSAILNALLAILAERRFHEGSTSRTVPLETMVAASNELPEEDELAALYDRFLLRFTVGYVDRDQSLVELLSAPEPPEPSQVLDRESLRALRSRVEAVDVSSTIVEDVVGLRRTLAAEGVIASDRRWRQSLAILRAAAVLDGRDRVETSDLRYFESMVWSSPEDIPKVKAAVQELAGAGEEESRKLLFQAQEVHAYAKRAWPDEESRARALIEAHAKLDELRKRMERLLGEARRRQRDTRQLESVKAEIATLQSGLLGTWN